MDGVQRVGFYTMAVPLSERTQTKTSINFCACYYYTW